METVPNIETRAARIKAATTLAHAMAHIGRQVLSNEEIQGSESEWMAYRMLGALSELVNAMALLPDNPYPISPEFCDCQLCRDYRVWLVLHESAEVSPC